ncbi:MAG: hypothetical protein KJO49_08995 [Bacteroidia bacterium]|nr:hypothetical protein [Bacteroidia bacterium]MBT8269604.1 hypothetical protein [Bacteroidia bacterium]
MKTFYTPFILLFTAVLISSCQTESIHQEQSKNETLFTVSDAKVDFNFTRDIFEGCLDVALIAGQHHEAGSILAETIGDDLVITYLAAEGWTIDATHMSIGICTEQWVPLTGSDNPKIGRFDHDSVHPDGTNEVTYTFPLAELTEDFCFATHAEVTSPEGVGETAWGSGIEFDGNSWAMYVDALLVDCDGDGGGDDPVVK